MLHQIGWKLLRWFGLSILALIIYCIYKAIFIPLYFRWKFGKYKNVYVSPGFIPLIGDFYAHYINMTKNKMHYAHLRDQANDVWKYDVKADIECITPVITIVSEKAYREVVSMSPAKIDKMRWEKGLFKIFRGSLANFPTSDKIKHRRKTTSNFLGIGSASRFVSVMFDNVERGVNIMKEKKRFDFMEEINAITFQLTMGSFFGNDIKNLPTEKFDYEKSDGTIDKLTLSAFFVQLSLDVVAEFVHPLNNIFPIINKKNLINPFRRNGRNLNKFRDTVKEMAKASKDTNSLWSVLKNNDELTEEEKFNDVFLFIVGGSDTTAHLMAALMYLLKKYPEKLEKLKEELKKHGITGGPNIKEQITFEKLVEIDYLTCIFKEALRMDTAVQFSFYYEAKRKIKLCGIPLEKGTMMKMSFIEAHYSEEYWLEPRKFIPERFDTNSDFYKESKKQGKIFNTYSRRSFGLGPRKCPGESFSLLTTKVLVAYMVTMMDYDVDQELLDNEDVGFALGSHFKPMFTIKT